MRDEDLTAICDRTESRNEAGISTRAFPLESLSNKEREAGEKLASWSVRAARS